MVKQRLNSIKELSPTLIVSLGVSLFEIEWFDWFTLVPLMLPMYFPKGHIGPVWPLPAVEFEHGTCRTVTVDLQSAFAVAGGPM